MKRIQYILATAILALTFTSCEDFFSESHDSYYETKNLFVDLPHARLAVDGIYQVLSNPNHYGQFEMAMATSDDMYYINGTNSDGNRRDISHYMVTPTNSWVETLWTKKYDGIDRANQVINNIRNMQEYKDGDPEALKYEGEALFLRALLSYDLVRYWGDVPYRTKEVVSVDDAYIGRTDREKIYDQIVNDLDRAKNQLPWAKEGSNSERATQGAARGLLMRVYLQRAGYSLKLNGAYSRPDDAIRQKYFEAVLEEFAEFGKNGFHKLYPQGYLQFWKNFSQDIVDPVESIFEVAFYTPDGKDNGAGTWGTYIGPYNSAKDPKGRANAFFRVLPEWLGYYEESDGRRDVNITHQAVFVSTKNNYDQYWCPAKWRREWMGNNPKDPNNTNTNFVYLRYADVLLMAAEAMNELNRTDEAVDLLNQVRTRAGATALDKGFANFETLYQRKGKWEYFTGKENKSYSYNMAQTFLPTGSNQEKFRVALFWERGFECCFELTRKYDLIRWGILEDAIKMHSTSPQKKGYAAGYNEKNPGNKGNFVHGKHELFPIPLSEISINTKITENNPGY